MYLLHDCTSNTWDGNAAALEAVAIDAFGLAWLRTGRLDNGFDGADRFDGVHGYEKYVGATTHSV